MTDLEKRVWNVAKGIDGHATLDDVRHICKNVYGAAGTSAPSGATIRKEAAAYFNK